MAHCIDFPIIFKICVDETVNKSSRYKNVGYQDSFDFFNGQSMYNSSIFGWTGHTQNGSTLTSTKDKKWLFKDLI